MLFRQLQGLYAYVFLPLPLLTLANEQNLMSWILVPTESLFVCNKKSRISRKVKHTFCQQSSYWIWNLGYRSPPPPSVCLLSFLFSHLANLCVSSQIDNEGYCRYLAQCLTLSVSQLVCAFLFFKTHNRHLICHVESWNVGWKLHWYKNTW